MDGTKKSSHSERNTGEQGPLLLVEDEQPLLRLMEKLLSQHGYRVFTAADGEEAIEIYQCHKEEIDVVLLDVGLPRMPGWEVLLKLKAENPNVCVVIASGFLESEIRTAGPVCRDLMSLWSRRGRMIVEPGVSLQT